MGDTSKCRGLSYALGLRCALAVLYVIASEAKQSQEREPQIGDWCGTACLAMTRKEVMCH